MCRKYSIKELHFLVQNEITKKMIQFLLQIPDTVWDEENGWKICLKNAKLQILVECDKSLRSLQLKHMPPLMSSVNMLAGFCMAFHLSSESLSEYLDPIQVQMLTAIQVTCFLLNPQNKCYTNYPCYIGNDNRSQTLKKCLQNLIDKDTPMARQVVSWCIELLSSSGVNGIQIDLSREDNGVDKRLFQCPTCFIPPGNYNDPKARLCTFLPLACMPEGSNPCCVAKNGFCFTGGDNRIKCICCKAEYYFGWHETQQEYGHKPQCCFTVGVSCTCDFQMPGNLDDPCYSNYRECQARIETLESENAITLAEAGFFRNGHEVQCWYCGGGLRNWYRCKQPWTEHAGNYPICSYVLKSKGPSFVSSAVLDMQRRCQSDRNKRKWRKLLMVMRFVKHTASSLVHTRCKRRWKKAHAAFKFMYVIRQAIGFKTNDQ